MICRVCGTSFYHQTAVTTAKACMCGMNIASVELFGMDEVQRAEVQAEINRRRQTSSVEYFDATPLGSLIAIKLVGRED